MGLWCDSLHSAGGISSFLEQVTSASSQYPGNQWWQYSCRLRAQIKMVRQIMEGRYDFDDDKWKEDKISQYARDLISKILVLDTQSRLTVEQCLSHEFFFPLGRRMSSTSVRLKQPPSR